MEAPSESRGDDVITILGNEDSDGSGTVIRRHRSLTILQDGSISASGYFAGLDRDQAQHSFRLLHEEYGRHIGQHDGSPMGDCCWSGQSADVEVDESDARITHGDDGGGGDDNDEGADDTDADADADADAHADADADADADPDVDSEKPKICKAQMQDQREKQMYEELTIFWGKRNWRRIFELYTLYEGPTELKVTWWNRLVSWLWSALSSEHMQSLQATLHMLRTPTFSLPDLTYEREGGKERSELQQALIRTCYRVMRSEDKQDLARIVQRYYLTRMYGAH